MNEMNELLTNPFFYIAFFLCIVIVVLLLKNNRKNKEKDVLRALLYKKVSGNETSLLKALNKLTYFTLIKYEQLIINYYRDYIDAPSNKKSISTYFLVFDMHLSVNIWNRSSLLEKKVMVLRGCLQKAIQSKRPEIIANFFLNEIMHECCVIGSNIVEREDEKKLIINALLDEDNREIVLKFFKIIQESIKILEKEIHEGNANSRFFRFNFPLVGPETREKFIILLNTEIIKLEKIFYKHLPLES